LQSADADGVARVSSSVLRQLLINYLNAAVVTGNDKTFLTSRQYDLCAWLAQDRDAELQRRKKAALEERKEDLSPVELAADISPSTRSALDAAILLAPAAPTLSTHSPISFASIRRCCRTSASRSRCRGGWRIRRFAREKPSWICSARTCFSHRRKRRRPRSRR